MATRDHDSGFDVGHVAAQGRSASSPADSQIWLDGDVLACACPDCGAPMSIRLWLGLADCWRCGASVELTEEQQRNARRLLAASGNRSRAVISHPSPPARARRGHRREALVGRGRGGPSTQPVVKAPPPLPQPKPRRLDSSTSSPALAQRKRDGPPLQSSRLQHRESGPWSRWFKDLPAWLVSLVFHLVAVLLLGLWVIKPAERFDSITLATSVSYEDLEGDVHPIDAPDADAVQFDDPGTVSFDELATLLSPGPSDVLFQSDVVVPEDLTGKLPEVTELPLALPATAGTMLAGRDPSVRSELVRREGGTTETEAAVARGLQWLARHQNADGSWSLDAWHRAPKATGPGDGLGGPSDTAGTALALLPFLGAGQTHTSGDYRNEVFKGLRWLIQEQESQGDLRGSGIGQMYAHAQAAIVLSEAYAMTGDGQLRSPAQQALDFIVQAQHPAGGWRYAPGQPGDTSVIGWQLMALRSGKMAYLRVPQRVFDLAERYLDDAATDRYGAFYTYLPGGPPSQVMTAEALLCRQYLGWPRDHDGLRLGVAKLLRDYLPDQRWPNIYYWYYATQVMHNMGGREWNRWNAAMRTVLVDMQEKQGPLAGSWDPVGEHASRGGRIYMTSLAVCTLEVYYRYLPMYQPSVVKRYFPVANPATNNHKADHDNKHHPTPPSAPGDAGENLSSVP